MSTAPEWISALAALGALGAAIWAGITATRVYRLETEREQRAARQRERHAAELVAAWTGEHVYRRPGDDPDSSARSRRGVVLSNLGQGPVFEVVVESTDPEGTSAPPLELSLIPPGRYFVPRHGVGWGLPAALELVDGDVVPVMRRSTWAVTAMRFADGASRRWVRDDKGNLSPAPGT